MKTFKFSVFLLLVVLSVGFFGVAKAEELPLNFDISSIDPNFDLNGPREESRPHVYITSVALDKASYKVGEIITATVGIYNSAKTDVGAANIKIEVAGDFDDTDNPTIVYDLASGPSFSIAGGERRNINVNYTIPANVSGKNIKLRIWSELPGGIPMAWEDSSVFSVSGGVTLFKVTGAYVNVNIKGATSTSIEKFGLQTGVPIYKNKLDAPSSGEAVFTFTSASSVSVVPTITIYESSAFSGKQRSSTSMPAVTIGASEKVIRVPLPTFEFDPGVYEGIIELKDKDGIVRNQYLAFRYVVQGASAEVRSAVSSVSSVKSGEDFSVKLFLTGEPADIYFDEGESTVRDLSVSVDVKDAEGLLVAQIDKNIKIDQNTQIDLPLTAKRDANNLFITVIVKDNGKEIARYEQMLTSQSRNTQDDVDSLFDDDYRDIAITIVAGIVSLLLFYGLRSRRLFFAIITSLVVIAIAAVPFFVKAQWQGPTTTTRSNGGNTTASFKSILFSSPTDNQVFAPGAPLKIAGSTFFWVCENQATYYEIFISDGNGHTTRVLTGSAPKGGHNDLVFNKTFSSNFTAPTTPGNYTATITVKVTGTGKHSYKSVATAYQPYKVAAPGTTTTTTGGGGGGGGGSCPAGTTWCGTSCLTSCGGSGNTVQTIINPLIPATEGPVRFKNPALKITPPLGNPGYTCKIEWGSAFESYDKDTYCTFTGPSTSINFAPTSTTETSTTSPVLKKDTQYKMVCKQGTDDSTTQTTNAICRINWNYTEVN